MTLLDTSLTLFCCFSWKMLCWMEASSLICFRIPNLPALRSSLLPTLSPDSPSTLCLVAPQALSLDAAFTSLPLFKPHSIPNPIVLPLHQAQCLAPGK